METYYVLKKHIILLFSLILLFKGGVLFAAQSNEPTKKPQSESGIALDITSSPFLGSGNAPVVIVEFSDYECPFCARHESETLPQINKDYITTGKLRYVILELPKKDDPKESSYQAAEAALCAADQGKYWEIRKMLFQDIKKRKRDELIEVVQKVGIDRPAFEQCIDSHHHAETIRTVTRQADALKIPKIPAFILGLPDQTDSGHLKSVIKISGARPYNIFKAVIDGLIEKAMKQTVATQTKGNQTK